MQVVILAGGLGTRLRPVTRTVPKAMVAVGGKPFLEYELVLLRGYGITDIVLCVGYLGEKIEEYFGDGGEWGVRISYSRDGSELLGPAGAIKRAEAMLGDSFFVTYGDAYLRADYRALMETLLASHRLAAMAVYENHGKYGRSDVAVGDGLVTSYDKTSGDSRLDHINFGVTALRKGALALIPSGMFFGEEDFYGELVARQELLAFPVRDRFYEVGTPEALREFERFAASL